MSYKSYGIFITLYYFIYYSMALQLCDSVAATQDNF